MKIKTILEELNKGDTFIAEGTVVYNKNKEKRVSKRTGNAFYTQFVLLQDDSTGYSQNNDSLPISLLVKSDDEIENGTILKVKGDVDVYNGKKTYNGTIQDFIVEADDKPELVKQAQEVFGGKAKEEHSPTYKESKAKTDEAKKEAEIEQKKSIARSVAVKAVAEMVAGKQIKLPEFWKWVYIINDYVFNGEIEDLTDEDEEDDESEFAQDMRTGEKIPF
jgi:hypothetical protein